MGGKRRAQPSENALGKVTACGDGAAAQGGASRKRQMRGLRADGAAAGSAEGGSSDQEESILAPVTITFSMRCDPSALIAKKTAFDAALRKVAADFGGREFRVERTRVGPSKDTLQRVLSFLVDHVRPEICYHVCKPWRRELEARGFCNRTFLLCSTLASAKRADPYFFDSDDGRRHVRNEERRRLFQRLAQNALQRLHARAGQAEPALGIFHEARNLHNRERAVCADAMAFLQRSWGRRGSLHEWLQVPRISFISSPL